MGNNPKYQPNLCQISANAESISPLSSKSFPGDAHLLRQRNPAEARGPPGSRSAEAVLLQGSCGWRRQIRGYRFAVRGDGK